MSGLMGRSQFANSAEVAREKLVTNTLFDPYFSTPRRTWPLTLLVFPVPGGPAIRYSDVIVWSIRPIPSTVPLARSFPIAVIPLLVRREGLEVELVYRQSP